jgi:hypothetical protein
MLNAVLRVAMFLCAVTLPVGAVAHEVETNRGVACNTAAQVERFAWSNDGPAEIAAINAESRNACAIVNVAFIRGEVVSRMRTQDATYGIVAILVVGVVAPDGIHPIHPTKQFTLARIDEREA